MGQGTPKQWLLPQWLLLQWVLRYSAVREEGAMSVTRAVAPPRPHPAELLEEISRSVVRLHKEHVGLGPPKARTYIGEDVVVCVLEGGFSTAERTLLGHGKAGAVIQQRAALEDALREPLIETIERLVARKVVGFTSGVQPDGEISTEVFLLEPERPGRGAASRLLRDA
jgi:uncharacterized protein YbcI